MVVLIISAFFGLCGAIVSYVLFDASLLLATGIYFGIGLGVPLALFLLSQWFHRKKHKEFPVPLRPAEKAKTLIG